MPRRNSSLRQLLDQRILMEVDKKLRDEQGCLKFSIGEVARLTNVSYTKLRYWEDEKLLHPERGPEARPAREYTFKDLKRALWLANYLSINGGTPRRARRILEDSRADWLLDALLEKTWYGPAVSLSVEENIDRVSKVPLFHFLAPRVAKACLSLMCNGLYPSTGFAFSKSTAGYSFHHGELNDLNKALISLGDSILCFHNDQGLTSLLTQDVLYFSNPDDFTCEEIEFGSVGKVVLFGTELAEAGVISDNGEDENRRKALDRTLEFLKNLVQKQDEVGHASRVYSVHSGSRASTEIRLNDLAEVVMEVGKKQWDFCCILAPSYRGKLWDRTRLRVVGRSKRSPHRVGITLEHREGISSLAYELGQIVSVSDITQDPSLIARQTIEKDMLSALAVPATHAGKMRGAIYVASREKGAFDGSDEIILSLLGLAVGQALTTSGRAIEFEDDMIGHLASQPRVSDPSFSQFMSKQDLKTELVKKIQEAKDNLAGSELWMLALDINDSRRVVLEGGTREEWVVRDCWRHIGEMMKQLMQQWTDANDIFEGGENDWQIYRASEDRYVTVLENVSGQWPLKFGHFLKDKINRAPVEVEVDYRTCRVENLEVRAAVWKGSREFLRELSLAGELHAVETLIRLLKEALQYAKEKGAVAFRCEGQEPKVWSISEFDEVGA